jgi:hypothetical protein
MIKVGWLPGLGGMTFATILAQRAVVLVVLLVTAITCGRRTLVRQGGMTFFTGRFFMRPAQFEIRCVVVKVRRFPGLGGMTRIAFFSQSACVRVILLVTAKTICTGALVLVIDMTFFARNCLVRSCQHIGRLGVIINCWFPARGGVAGSADLTKLAVVVILFLVTIET